MTKITSIADFFHKVKDDEDYRRLLIYAYKKSEKILYDVTYEMAFEWLEKWIVINTKEYTCESMVHFLNKRMEELPSYPKTLISARDINVFTGKTNPYTSHIFS